MKDKFYKDEFYCYNMANVHGLYKSIFQDPLIQHCFGSLSEDYVLIIKPYSNNRINETINQFNFWITVFSKALEIDNCNIKFKSLTDYNNFVDEVFRLITRYPKFNSFDIGRYLWENKRIYTKKDFPKGVLMIRDSNVNVDFIRFNPKEFTFSQYKIEKTLHNYQNNNSMYLIDLGTMKIIPNKDFYNDNVSSLIL